VDHIVPRSKGGTDTLDNFQTLCSECNRRLRVIGMPPILATNRRQIIMLTIDLDPETEKRLDELCRRTGVTPSEAVRRSLADWLERLDLEVPDAYELGKDLFGQGGPAEPPVDPHKRQIWDSLHAKHRFG
jgi:hypothetical protein